MFTYYACDIITKGDVYMTLGNKIQEIRLARGMSQEQFGELLNTTRQTVSKWELDQVVPDLKNIIAISRLFCVSTDELLLEVSNFQNVGVRFACGTYRSNCSEIVETEKIAICYYARGKYIMGAKLYVGNSDVKYLVSVCEKDFEKETIIWAYADINDSYEITGKHTNDSVAENMLGELFDRKQLDRMQLQESFIVNHGEYPTHTVNEKGIRQCLLEWRNGSKVSFFEDGIHVLICIGKNEYVYSVCETDENIYCGCSYNVPFDLGLRSYGQFFRLRNYQDNSLPYCQSFFDFDYTMPQEICSVDCSNFGSKCSINDSDDKKIWYVKRYDDSEIVLDGCGGDEYTFRMNEDMYERFVQ